MTSIRHLWRTTTVRLTALFILIFVVAAVGLLALISYQSSIVIQKQQTADIVREVGQIKNVEQRQGIRAMALAVQRLASRPGPGIYYLGDDVGRMLAGNVADFPANVLAGEGFYTFDYARGEAFADTDPDSNERDNPGRPGNPTNPDAEGYALVQSALLPSGLRLIVGRDIVERRGFAAIIFEGFFFGVIGIVVLSVVTGLLTAMRVLKRIDAISGTSRMIMAGNLSERIPVTRRNDEYDQLATSLNAMLDRIEQLMQGLREVSDNVAHDLKTPLTRMRNRAESALRENTDQATMQQALETTISESDQLIRTFNALLMIARAEAGTPSAALSDVDFSEVITDVADLYAPLAEDAGVELQTEVPDGIHVHASRELIAQALVNLVENAIKYGASGKPDAKIRLALRQKDGRVQVEVSDNGPGIPAEDREHVIERFVRLEKSRTEPGSGLGLSLVAAVAQLHKGELRLENNEPGLRAILDLPA